MICSKFQDILLLNREILPEKKTGNNRANVLYCLGMYRHEPGDGGGEGGRGDRQPSHRCSHRARAGPLCQGIH